VPWEAMALATSMVGQSGPGYAARPSSSSSSAVSTMPSPLPPWASGRDRPSQPSWAISFHSAGLSPRGSSQSRRTVAGLQCSSRNERAEFLSSVWSGVKEKSMASSLQAIGADFLGQPEYALADDVLLDLGRAGVDRARPRPQERGGPGAGLARRGVDLLELLAGGHHLAPGAEDLQRGLVVALLELRVGELRDRRLGPRPLALVQRGQHAQAGIALHLELGVELAHLRPHDRIVEQRLAVTLELPGGPHQLVEGDGVAGDAAQRV